jgi:hypothetical protein
MVKKFRHVGQLIKEAEEIKVQPNNTNLKDVFSLSRLWKPLIHTPLPPRGDTTCALINISDNLSLSTSYLLETGKVPHM